MSSILAFSPTAATTTLSASTTSANGALAGDTTVASSIRVYNGSTAVAFIKYGSGAQTATSADLPVAPGATEIFNIGPSVDNVAAILSTGTGNVYVTRGGGL